MLINESGQEKLGNLGMSFSGNDMLTGNFSQKHYQFLQFLRS